MGVPIVLDHVLRELGVVSDDLFHERAKLGTGIAPRLGPQLVFLGLVSRFLGAALGLV